MDHATNALSVLSVISFVLGGYFLPFIIAMARDHRQKLAIFVLNLLLGWTVLGWIGALVWACTSDVKTKEARRDERATGA
jgi:hypothetical protein